MQEAILKARLHGGILERLPGGFWTYPGCHREQKGSMITYLGIPDWWVSTHTIKALVARGWFVELASRNRVLLQ
jgi:hypothetical protein